MTYLLSTLMEGSSSEKRFESLCYYINDTRFTQNIQIIDEDEYVFKKCIFPMERILFKAPDRACIKVITFLPDGIKTTEFESQELCIAEKCNSESALR